GVADLLEKGEAVGVGQAEVENQLFGGEPLELAAGFAPGPGKRQLVPLGEEPLVGSPERRFVLDEQHPASRAEGGRRHRVANIRGAPRPSTAAQLAPLSSSKRSSSLVSTRRNRSSSLAPRRQTVRRRSAALRWINIKAPKPALSIC